MDSSCVVAFSNNAFTSAICPSLSFLLAIACSSKNCLFVAICSSLSFLFAAIWSSFNLRFAASCSSLACFTSATWPEMLLSISVIFEVTLFARSSTFRPNSVTIRSASCWRSVKICSSSCALSSLSSTKDCSSCTLVSFAAKRFWSCFAFSRNSSIWLIKKSSFSTSLCVLSCSCAICSGCFCSTISCFFRFSLCFSFSLAWTPVRSCDSPLPKEG